MFGDAAFGMELDAVNRMGFVLESHDNTVFFRLGGDVKIGIGRNMHHEGMITAHAQGIGEPHKKAVGMVVDQRGFPVCRLRRANDLPTVHFADTLMAEADAENGDAVAELADDFIR